MGNVPKTGLFIGMHLLPQLKVVARRQARYDVSPDFGQDTHYSLCRADKVLSFRYLGQCIYLILVDNVLDLLR